MNDAIINPTVQKGRLRSTVLSIFQRRCHRDEMIPSQFSDGKTKAQRNQVPYQRCQREQVGDSARMQTGPHQGLYQGSLLPLEERGRPLVAKCHIT